MTHILAFPENTLPHLCSGELPADQRGQKIQKLQKKTVCYNEVQHFATNPFPMYISLPLGLTNCINL